MGRFLITSALPYINGVKHLGNLAGSMLPADVHARFRRMQGHEVLFVCATDEHGTPAELAAHELGVTPQAYCDEQHLVQRDVCAQFGLSFDWFGRSSSAANRELTQQFCDALEDAGLIEERVQKQVYSPVDGRFLPDRYVEGTCPRCSFDSARGDQCDNCGTLLDPTSLINPRSKISGSRELEIRDTRHLFLLQSKMASELRRWIDSRVGWPPLAKSIAYQWLDGGLNDRAITRDLSWGIPVLRRGITRPGFENKVFYVWFDAPIEYIGATVEWAKARGMDWRRWWRDDAGATDVAYIQFMGKDNVAFHTISFPTTLLGSGEPWHLVDRLKAFHWVTWYGGKFSTSQRRGVFMDTALRLLPADYWRWKLMASAPEGADSPFTWGDFQNTVNSDLANVLGNFVNRVISFAIAKFDGVVPDGGSPGALEADLFAKVEQRIKLITEHHEAMEFRRAASETRALWADANEYLQVAAPWKTIKSNPAEAATAIRTGLNLCALFSRLSYPFMPETAERLSSALGLKDMAWPSEEATELLDSLPHGAGITTPGILFRKIEDAEVEAWKAEFGAEPGAE